MKRVLFCFALTGLLFVGCGSDSDESTDSGASAGSGGGGAAAGSGGAAGKSGGGQGGSTAGSGGSTAGAGGSTAGAAGQAGGGAAGQAGSSGAAGGEAGASGAGGEAGAAGAGGEAGAAGAATCPPTSFEPLTACDSPSPSPSAQCFCMDKGTDTDCAGKWDACAADEGCSKAVYCFGQGCDLNTCAALAGAGLSKAVALQGCQPMLAQCMGAGGAAGAAGAAGAGGEAGAAGAGGAGGEAGAAGAAGAGGMAPCNSIANTSDKTVTIQNESSAWTPAGGAIADGTYFITAMWAYPGSPLAGFNATFRQTMIISQSGTHGEVAADDSDKGMFTQTYSFAPSGTMLNMTVTCNTEPTNQAIVYETYSVNGDVLSVHNDAFKFRVDLTKQP